jgi:branched-chain amino acid transport system ATP-binding protein
VALSLRRYGRPKSRAQRLSVLRGISLNLSFAGLQALSEVSVDLNRNEVLGLIGPNGAGKTTLVNVLAGFQRPDSGTVVVDAQQITKWAPQKIARAGVVRTFQAVRPFSQLTVRDNVMAGAVGAGMSPRAARSATSEILDLFGLRRHEDSSAAALPHGSARHLGLARALAAEPSFLLLDEPAAGLDERETDELLRKLALIRSRVACGMLVIEHDMRVIMRLCDRIQVLDHGQTICIGTPAEVRRDPQVLAAYLGAPES